MRRSMQFMIRLAVLVPLVTVSPAAHAYAPSGRLVMHTNQGDLVRHSNQESHWFHIVFEPEPIVSPPPSALIDPSSIDWPGLWAHGNSPRMPRMKTPPVNTIPAPGTVAVLAALLGMPRRRRHSRVV